ncbi:uncharacterized protein EV422DRAFT_543235 [Fimicolochytrium jonesii]|uniref:uncharacterized protein n=1 Tax=Fimicolochytrium jonesii TaxID=1396493 RepID=UPI0022FE67C8|nr:uncharacterized protein EV422DRAFT_543235 [Fimicolochytrium jonesii]KAI8817066.1 hypothetical protein EV422DRAFT_543235 [Fimicolochytrium jonesii]
MNNPHSWQEAPAVPVAAARVPYPPASTYPAPSAAGPATPILPLLASPPPAYTPSAVPVYDEHRYIPDVESSRMLPVYSVSDPVAAPPPQKRWTRGQTIVFIIFIKATIAGLVVLIVRLNAAPSYYFDTSPAASTPTTPSWNPAAIGKVHTGDMTGLQISPDDRYVVVSNATGMKAYKMDDDKLVYEFRGSGTLGVFHPQNKTTFVSVSTDGTSLISTKFDDTEWTNDLEISNPPREVRIGWVVDLIRTVPEDWNSAVYLVATGLTGAVPNVTRVDMTTMTVTYTKALGAANVPADPVSDVAMHSSGTEMTVTFRSKTVRVYSLTATGPILRTSWIGGTADTAPVYIPHEPSSLVYLAHNATSGITSVLRKTLLVSSEATVMCVNSPANPSSPPGPLVVDERGDTVYWIDGDLNVRKCSVDLAPPAAPGIPKALVVFKAACQQPGLLTGSKEGLWLYYGCRDLGMVFAGSISG